MVIYFKTKSRRYLPLGRRDDEGLNALDRLQLKQLSKEIPDLLHLYKVLSNVNNYFENALNTSVGSLRQQAVAIQIVENELNKAKQRLQILEEEKNNKIRLVEINTYYSDKYAEHSALMKIIIFTLIPVIILGVLNNKGILPGMIYNILLVIISFIGAYFFWRRFASIITRDNMNYQEYNWHFDPAAAPSDSVSSSDDPWLTNTPMGGTCVGDSCCSSGLTYDNTLNQCVTSTTTESFVNQTLTKKQSNYKPDVNLRELEAFNTQR